jgi:SAM-dependent MidA family methyltransferase
METRLSEIIKNKILTQGPISFHDFMEMFVLSGLLFSSSPDKIGKHGDCYTSSYLTNVFGNVIAKQLEEMYSDCKKDFTVKYVRISQ